MSDLGADKYQLIAELGHGGMADVYLAVLSGMQDFKKLAVIKRLRKNLAEDPDFLAMFLQEARIAARLNHPNVVHTFEVGHDGKYHFMAMEYLEGHPYSALIARVGRENIDLGIQIKILIDALEGLHYAHQLADFDGRPLGLVHRDVSPQNVFVTYDGQVKLLDFGIAKALDSAVETRAGIVKGKLAYMSPEQALANPLDRRADVYSLGVMLWEAVAGRRRWKGLTDVELMKAIVRTRDVQLPPPRSGQLPASLANVLKRALAYRPDDRYASAREFQADLEKVLDEFGNRVTHRDVGKLVIDLFELDRARLRATIDAEIKNIELATDDRVRSSGALKQISIPNTSLTPTMESRYSPGSSSRPVIESSGVSSGIPNVAVSQPQEVAKPPVKSRRLLWVAALAVTLAGVVLFVQSRRRQSAAANDAVAPSASVADNVNVQVRVLVRPLGSEILIDDAPVSNPYTSTLPRSRGHLSLRAQSPGHQPEARIISLADDVNLEISLAAIAPTTTKTTTQRAPRGVPIGAPRVTAAAPVEPPPPVQAPPSEPAPKPPPRAEKPSRPLDSENPWK